MKNPIPDLINEEIWLYIEEFVAPLAEKFDPKKAALLAFKCVVEKFETSDMSDGEVLYAADKAYLKNLAAHNG